MSSSIQRRIGSVLLLAAGAVLGAIAALAFGTTEFHDREREAESIAAQPMPPLTSTIETAAVDASSEDRAASPPSATTHFLCGVKFSNRRLPRSRKHTEVATEPPVEPIRGHTVNQQGEPVAGVVIWASPPPRPIPPRPTTGRAVAARQAALQSELDATALQAERMIEVRSEADGSFTIPIRENAPHTLEARARGYSVQPPCAPQEAVFPGESVELVLCPLVAVPVDVRFSTDAQAPFAMIQCHRFAAPNMSELFFEEPWRAEDSVLYLGAGRWEIRAKHDRLDGGDVEVSEQCPLTLTDGVPHEPMRLSLRPMIGIRGSVRASGENTLPALHLVLAAGSVADPQTPLIDTGRPQCYIAGETRSAAFEFLDLNPGLYTLHVYYDISNARATSLQIMVKDRLEVADLTIPSPAFASGRRVRVLGPDGAPIDGCSFAMRYSVQDSVDFEDVTASRRRRGEYFVSWSLIPGAKLLGFSIRSRDAGVMFLPAAEGDGMLEARFAPPALVRVRIPKASQQYLRAQYQVWITDERLRERLGQADLIDHNGGEALEASIGPIQPGSYEVALWGSIQTKLSQRGENLRPLQRMSIDIASGENHLVLTPGQLYQLRVRVLSDSNVGAYEVGELRRNPEDGLSVEIDPEPVSENTYEYERVPPGSYHYIVQSRYGLLKRTVQIPGDGEQIVRLEPPNALLVSSSKMGSPVDAQLQEGDLIRAIDGVSITSMECKEACLTLAYNRPESVWRVERNGEILDVSLRLRGLDAVAVLRLRRMLELVRR